MEVSELSEGCNVVTTTKEDSSSDGKVVKSEEVLAFPADNDEKTTRENQPRVTYTKEDLLNLRESPASKLWPSVFSDEYVRSGIWDPEPWHQSHSREKRCVSPGEELKKQLLLIEDGIVLSPQRQSFVQGCHIPQSVPERRSMQERGKAGLIRTTDRDKDGRSRLTGRVGKGRALDYKELMPLQVRNKDSDTPSGKYTGTQERVERIDKGRGSGKDKEKGLKEKEWKRSKEDREQGKKKQGQSKRNEEPEWFTYGPSSQFETMELKGFDAQESSDHKKDKERRKSLSDEIKAILSVGKKGLLNGEVTESSPETSGSASQNSDQDRKMASAYDNLKAKAFDINDFFIGENLLPLSGVVDQSSSRFCQFFGQPGSNYSSSRSGSAGCSSGGLNTPRTPSPGANHFFTPITPSVDDGIESQELADVLQKTQVSVQPLLDEVMSSGKEKGKVMGSVRLEDIEADVAKDSDISTEKDLSNEEKNKEIVGDGDDEMLDSQVKMEAFNRLVEKMKTSGTLPEKPQPAISGLPTHLLPRPPSPKKKSPRNSPSPVLGLRRSPSPAELLRIMTMQAPLTELRPPSPAQVVPQMNRATSPLELFQKFNSLVTSPQELFSSPLLQRSSSPLAVQARYRRSPPLGFDPLCMQLVPNQGTPLYKTRPQRGDVPRQANQQSVRKSHEKQDFEGNTPEQRGQRPVHSKPSSSHAGSPYIPDRSFMPTAVMRKIQQDRMDQKISKTEGKSSALDSSKEITDHSGTVSLGIHPKQLLTNQESAQLNNRSQAEDAMVKGSLFAKFTEADEKMPPPQTSTSKQDTLIKPAAFKPLPGSPQAPFSSLNSGIHSEPASPMHAFHQSASSMLPNSAPCTPQRHPLVDKASLLSPLQLVSKGPFTREDGKKSSVGLFGSNVSLESHSKNIRGSITKVVTASEGRPLAHSYEQLAHVAGEKMAAGEDTFHGKRSENLLGNNPVSKGVSATYGGHRTGGSEVTAQQEGLTTMYPRQRIPGGDARPTPVLHAPRSFQGPHGLWPRAHMPNGQLMSPSGLNALHGHPGHTPFNSPMHNMGMPPRPGLLPGMLPHHVHPAYLRMMSSASSPMGMPHPGMTPVSQRMQIPHVTGRIPAMPGHHPAMMYGGRPLPGYLPGNPAAAAATAAMKGARSPHIPPQSLVQPSHVRQVASPVMNHPPQSRSPAVGSNILSKWFSDEFLQQANPGQRSATPDFARKVVSVEEIERQQAATIN